MLAFLKLIATLAAGTSVGVAVFDGVLHGVMLKRTHDVKRHLGLALARFGHSIYTGIVLWYVIIPAPVEAWSTKQAYGFIFGLLLLSTGLMLASGATYSDFIDTEETQ